MTSLLKCAALVALAAASLADPVAAAPIRLQPDEASSRDVFVYEFDVPGVFGIPTAAADTNLDSDTLNRIDPRPVPFGNFLGAAETDPFSLTPGGPLRRHTTRTLIGFDLTGVDLAGQRVTRAVLNLFALPALPAFDSPSADFPVTTDLRAVSEAWGETTVTWNNRPGVFDPVEDSVAQDGVNRWVSFEVTRLVLGWIDDPMSNHGMQLSQRAVVDRAVPDARDRYFASLYASSAFADPTLRPYLEIETAPAAVPLPASAVLMLGGLGALVSLRRRARAARVA